jgi:hypothetical protein
MGAGLSYFEFLINKSLLLDPARSNGGYTKTDSYCTSIHLSLIINNGLEMYLQSENDGLNRCTGIISRYDILYSIYLVMRTRVLFKCE